MRLTALHVPVGCAAALLLLGVAAGPGWGSEPEIAIRTTPRPGLPARAAALLVSGQQGGPVAVEAIAVPLAVAGDRVRLAVAVDVDGASLLGGAASGVLPVDFAVYAVTDTGGVAAAASSAVVLDLERGAAAIAAAGIKLVLSLEAPLAVTRVRALVYAAQGPSFGVVEVPVGDFGGALGGGLVAPPVLDDPGGAWLIAAEDVAGAPYPFLLGADPVVPAARPVLAPGAEREAWLVSRGQPADLAGVSVTVVAADGSDLGPVEMRAVGRVAGDGVDLDRVSLVVPMLSPGSYALRVAGAPAAGGVRPTATLPIVIAPVDVGGEPVVWTTLLPGRRHVARPAAPATVASDGGDRQPVNALQAAYLAALGRLSTEGRAATLDAVAEAEAGALAGDPATGAARLLEAETQITRRLRAAEASSLLGLLALHLDLHRRYGEASRFDLQSHARTRVEELAAASAVHGGVPDSLDLATAALSCLAGEMHLVGSLASAGRLYRIALDLDPSNATARSGLAAVLEAGGLFPEAVAELETLVRTLPDDAEARLRLAVNLARVGDAARAADLLEGCSGPENPAWVRAVAYQELARSRIDDSDWQGAAALLGRALDALPDDRGLVAQQAFVLGRSGRAVQARAASRRALRATTAPSPRYRYARPPASEVASVCAVVEGRRGEADAALVRALEALPGGAE